MANTAGGRYHANPQQAPQSQYSSYVPGGGGQYYPQAQQHQHHQQMGYQYYGNQSQPAHHLHQQQASAMGYQARPPAPPPPPPPGETVSSTTPTSTSITSSASYQPPNTIHFNQGHPHQHPSAGRPYVTPLLPPPLPPMFPWMSPALAKSMTSSPYGKSFEKEACNLPFVPIIVNDADLIKMTENVAKEAEEVNNLSLQYYKEVMKLNLPKALKDQFQPLFCKLCILSLSSPVVAKDHYNGKRHKKAVEAWMTRNPLPPMFSNYPKKTNEQPIVSSTTGPTGLINGFIAKHYPKTNDASAPSSKPPIPPLMQSNAQKEPLPLNIDRKRPAPPPPAPPKLNIQNQEHNVNIISKPLAPPTPLLSAQSNNDSRARGGPPFNNTQNNPGSWQTKANDSGNGNQADFPQAKKPRRSDQPIPAAIPFTQGLCQICNVQLSSQVMADQHFKGKNHASKLAALEEHGGSGTGAAGVLRVDLNPGGNSSQPTQRPPGAPSGNPNNNNKPFNRGPQKPAFQRGGGGGGAPPHFNQNRGNNNNRGMNKNNRFNNNKRGGKWS